MPSISAIPQPAQAIAYPPQPGPASAGYAWHHAINADGSPGWIQVPIEQTPFGQQQQQQPTQTSPMQELAGAQPLGAQSYARGDGFFPLERNVDIGHQLQRADTAGAPQAPSPHGFAPSLPVREPNDALSKPPQILGTPSMRETGGGAPIPVREPGDHMSRNPQFRMDQAAAPAPMLQPVPLLPAGSDPGAPPQYAAPYAAASAAPNAPRQPGPPPAPSPAQAAPPPPQVMIPVSRGIDWSVDPATALQVAFDVDSYERQKGPLPAGTTLALVRWCLGIGPFPFKAPAEEPREAAAAPVQAAEKAP